MQHLTSPTRLRSLTSTAAALALLGGAAAGQTSVKSGHFLDPAVWDTGEVPGPGDTVIITEEHTVGLVPQGMSVEPVRLKGLTVRGTLTSSWPMGMGGEPVLLEVGRFECPDGGAVLGEPSFFGPGGSVHIAFDDAYLPWGAELDLVEAGPFECIAHGFIAGGDGVDGGDVIIDFPGGRFEHCGTTVGGSGTRGGSVRVIATHAENFQHGKIHGGDGGIGGGGSADLIVTTTATSGPAFAVNMPGAEVLGGDSAGGEGGDAGFAAYDPFGKGADLIHEGIISEEEVEAVVAGGDGAEPGRAWVAAPAGAILGIVEGGADTDVDPFAPAGAVDISFFDGVVTGDASIAGGAVTIRTGGTLALGPFAKKPAVVAGALELAAGTFGAVDLTASVPADFAVAAPMVAAAPGTLSLPATTPLPALLPGVVGPLPPVDAPETRIATSSASIAYADESAGSFDLRLDLHVGQFGTDAADVEVLLAADPSLGLPPTTILPAAILFPGDDVRLSLDTTLTPGPSAGPLLFVELHRDGVLLETVELPLALIPRKPSVELFGEGESLLFFEAPGAFAPPLAPVAGSLTVVGAGAPGLKLAWVALGFGYSEPPLVVAGLDFWVVPTGPLLAMPPAVTPSLPLVLTDAGLAGVELHTQAVVFDPAAAPGAELTTSNVAKLVFRP